MAVSYEKEPGGVRFSISIPEGCKAVFRIDAFERELAECDNEFFVSDQSLEAAK